MAVIAIASDKGGVSKTSLALLVGAEAASTATEPAFSTLTSTSRPLRRRQGQGSWPDRHRRHRSDEHPGGASASRGRSRHRHRRSPGRGVRLGLEGLPPLAFRADTGPAIDAGRESGHEDHRPDRRCPGVGARADCQVSGLDQDHAWLRKRAVRQVRAAMEESADVPIFRTALMERAAFRDIHISGLVPRQKDPNGGPAKNVAALTGELLNRSPS